MNNNYLVHWGKGSTKKNHKYIAKIGSRYFYTQSELDAYNKTRKTPEERRHEDEEANWRSILGDPYSKRIQVKPDRTGGGMQYGYDSEASKRNKHPSKSAKKGKARRRTK